MPTIKEWMAAASVPEQEALASLAGTSRQYLYHISNGVRQAGAGLAGKLETASESLWRSSKGRLPRLTRADISPVCAKCHYAKKCLDK